MTFFEDRHFDQTQCVEKSPKAKQYFIACYRTRYALKGVAVIKIYRHFDQTKCVEKSPKAKQTFLVTHLSNNVIQRVEKPEESPGKDTDFQ